MDVKGTLKAVTLELRRELDGRYDAQGTWHPGDLERRLASIGVWRDREPKPLDELPRLVSDDREARRVVDAFLESRREAGRSREDAIAEFVRNAAYTWANRLLALRCMEARGLVDEVILQKDAYGGRSLQHNRLAKKQPERCAGEDEGLFATLSDEFARRAEELPLLFDPRAREVVLRPSVAALKRCIALLSGTLTPKGQDAPTDEVFAAPDTLGWTYQYWNAEEKERVFDRLRTKKGYKIEGAEIAPATCIYTESYMVKFLVQNSLGAIWMGMYPHSRLSDTWEYYVADLNRSPLSQKAVADITFLDPACGSGHFLTEAFEILYAMYIEEGALTEPKQICASILERNLYGVEIDERAAQIAALALVMKAKEKAPDFVPRRVNLVSTNIRLPAGEGHLEAFLNKHPEDVQLKPALRAIFDGLAHADEVGSLLQISEPVEKELRAIKTKYEESGSPMEQQALWSEFQKPVQGKLPIGLSTYEAWKERLLSRVREHFDAEARDADLGAAFFGEAASKGLSLVHLLSRRYDVLAANPPYLGMKKVSERTKEQLTRGYDAGRNDLATLFMERMTELRNPQGILAFVSNASFLWLQLHEEIRTHLRRVAPPTLVAHLGPYAFEEMRDHVDGVMYIAAQSTSGRTTWFRTVDDRDKEPALKAAVAGRPGSKRYSLELRAFDLIPGSPFVYWVAEQLSALYSERHLLAKIAKPRSGLQTSDIDRFVRNWWETSGCWLPHSRWVPYVKGGESTAWVEADTYALDWQANGLRVKEEARRRYGSVTRTVKNQAWYFKEGLTFSLSSGMGLAVRQLPARYVFDVSSPTVFCELADAGWLLALLNSATVASIIQCLNPTMHVTVLDVERLPIPKVDANLQHLLAAAAEAAVSAASEVISFFPTAQRFASKQAPTSANSTLSEYIQIRRTEFEAAVARLRAAEKGVDDLVENALRVTLPARPPRWTDEISMRATDFVENYVTGMILGLFGFCWRGTKCEQHDGPAMVAVTSISRHQRLLDFVRARIEADFGAARLSEVEAEFETLFGERLEIWLQRSWFSRHVSVFRKRPIVWKIESTPARNANGRGNAKVRKGPVFSCLVYYHQLDADLLPKLRTQNLGPFRTSLQTELAGLEKLKSRTAEQDERRIELEGVLDELETFDARLEQVIVEGFGSPGLVDILANERLDQWTSRDGRIRPPATQDEFLAQECRYDPDLNDGVRVNIAPLQRAGLLAAEALPTKDVERAIADRAERRADERRWCREGKLPQPGWWPVARAVDVPEIPDVLPAMDAAQEAMLFVWALLYAAGGSFPRMAVAHAFSLRCNPSLLRKYTPSDLQLKASGWADRVGQRTVAAGLLATVLSDLAGRDIVRLTTDEASRSVVTIGPRMPADEKVDAWFHFEALLVLRVLATLQPAQVQEIERGITGDDRKLLAAEAA